MKLIECMPKEFGLEYADSKAFKFADIEVIKEYSDSLLYHEYEKWKRWIGKHKNVHYWVILANGYAIAWNENPKGWSFPVIKYDLNQ